VVNGRPIDATFDSGAGTTSMNWAEARALGIAPGDPRLHAYMAGGSRLMMINARRDARSGDANAPTAADSTFAIAGLALQIGHTRLAADTVFITDADFADAPTYTTEPMLVIGLRELHSVRLLLSYSTGFVCLGSGPGR
jgi:hypothetical protein